MRPDTLAEQQALLHAVLGPGEGGALSAWLPVGSPAQQRFFQRGVRAYRANGQALAERALMAAYPLLTELLGQENFAPLARHFWAAHPPQGGDMACWGAELAVFVSAEPQLAGEPYLGDVARLEWLLHEAASAADVAADLASFALLGAEDPALVTLVLGAGVAVLVSPHPVASIVNAHLLGSPTLAQAGQRLAEGCSEHVLVWRQGFRPSTRVSSAAEHRLLGELFAGVSLLQALEAAAAEGSADAANFDFNTWLAQAVQTGLVCGVRRLPLYQGKT